MASEVIPFQVGDSLQILSHGYSVEGFVERINSTKDKLFIQYRDQTDPRFHFNWVDALSNRLYPEYKNSAYTATNYSVNHTRIRHNAYKWNINLPTNNKNNIIYVGLFNKVHETNMSEIISLLKRMFNHVFKKQIQINTSINKLQKQHKCLNYPILVYAYIRSSNIIVPPELLQLVFHYYGVIEHQIILLKNIIGNKAVKVNKVTPRAEARIRACEATLTKLTQTQNEIIQYENKLNELKKSDSPHKVWNKYGYLLFDNSNYRNDHLEIILDKNKGVINCNNRAIGDIGKHSNFELQVITFRLK